MHYRLNNLYYTLSIFVLGTALFVMHPEENPTVAQWQDNIKEQLSVSFQQLWGDEPFFSEVAFIYNGVNEFYNQSSSALVAMIGNETLDSDIVMVFGEVYNSFSYMFDPNAAYLANKTQGSPDPELSINLAEFMTEEPIYDLATIHTAQAESGSVAGWSAPSTTPVNLDNPWFTVVDGFTGQVYCMAIYNGEVNKYLGECKYDYY